MCSYSGIDWCNRRLLLCILCTNFYKINRAYSINSIQYASILRTLWSHHWWFSLRRTPHRRTLLHSLMWYLKNYQSFLWPPTRQDKTSAFKSVIKRCTCKERKKKRQRSEFAVNSVSCIIGKHAIRFNLILNEIWRNTSNKMCTTISDFIFGFSI